MPGARSQTLKSAVPTTARGDLRTASPSTTPSLAPQAAKPASAPTPAATSSTRTKPTKARRARGESSGDDDLDDLEVERVTGAHRTGRK